jgi:hypothetical protein
MGPVPPGVYIIDVQMISYLRAGEREFEVIAGATTELPTVILLGGDCNSDDNINIVDAGIVSFSFGLSAGQFGFDPRADINNDGLVDIYDLVMVGNNFGCSITDFSLRCIRWGRQ